MQRLFSSMMLAMIILLLTGCMSIPIGDNVLEISGDGIDFVEKDSNNNKEDLETNDENELDDANEMEEGSGENNNQSVEEEEPENNSFLTNNNEGDKSTETDLAKTAVGSSTRQCEEQNYSEVTNHVDTEIFIPDCAIMTDVSKGDNQVTANYKVAEVDWQELLNEFREYYEDDLFDESINFEGERVNAKIELDNDYIGHIEIKSSDEGASLWYKIEKK